MFQFGRNHSKILLSSTLRYSLISNNLQFNPIFRYHISSSVRNKLSHLIHISIAPSRKFRVVKWGRARLSCSAALSFPQLASCVSFALPPPPRWTSYSQYIETENLVWQLLPWFPIFERYFSVYIFLKTCQFHADIFTFTIRVGPASASQVYLPLSS